MICRYVKYTLFLSEAFLLNPVYPSESLTLKILFSKVYINRYAVHINAQEATYKDIMKVSNNSANNYIDEPIKLHKSVNI